LARIEKRRYSDRRQYLIRAVYARRKKVRRMAVEYKGGKCEICGYDRCMDALEFHHKDASSKDFGISEKGHSRSWIKVMEELDKCIMICANCHRELHARLAASGGNSRVKKRVNSGKAHSLGSILSQARQVGKVQRLDTRCLNSSVIVRSSL
jgi:5-methylcytosine-specific restriction endonuclease McrA